VTTHDSAAPRLSSEARLSRRTTLASIVALAVLLATPAWAGSYLDRCVLVVTGAAQEADFLQYRVGNRELARLVHELARARLEATRTMEVPKEVAQAHPHLLLMLDNYERASDAALNGEAERFMIYLGRARDEEQVFRSVLEQLGFPLTKKKGPRGLITRR
jgi:hypothetical protein